MLAERMAAGVASGVYQVEHMAAVTFTRKAASELRGRFHIALERLLQPETSAQRLDAESSARVHRALSNLERFFAGTIHAFCARLLRERPVESGVAPGFSELDEVQDLDLRRRGWRDFIVTERSAGNPECSLARGYVSRRTRQRLCQGVLHEDVDSAGDGQERMSPPSRRRSRLLAGLAAGTAVALLRHDVQIQQGGRSEGSSASRTPDG